MCSLSASFRLQRCLLPWMGDASRQCRGSANASLSCPYHILLKKHWQKEGFRPCQLDIIRTIVEQRRDVLAVLPTGHGKSACFQIAGAHLAAQEGSLTLVVSPLKALMWDQVHALTARGLRASVINSDMTDKERSNVMENVTNRTCDILYVAPERLHSKFIADLRSKRQVGLLVVDEAHSIPQHGHFFRQSYLDLGQVRRRLGPSVVTAAFTATGAAAVRHGILQTLGIPKAVVFNGGADRPNIRLESCWVHDLPKVTPDLPDILSPGAVKIRLLQAAAGNTLRAGSQAEKLYRYLARRLEGAAGEWHYLDMRAAVEATDIDASKLRVRLKYLEGKKVLELEIQPSPQRRGMGNIWKEMGEKPEAFAALVPTLRAGHSIVYCATRSRVETVRQIAKSHGLKSFGYHAGLSSRQRKEVLGAFFGADAGDVPILATSAPFVNNVVATSSFGLGIDIPDIRTVVHFDMPGGLEQYWQEAGRAGRDGLPARAVLFASTGAYYIQLALALASHPRAAWIRHAFELLYTHRHETTIRLDAISEEREGWVVDAHSLDSIRRAFGRHIGKDAASHGPDDLIMRELCESAGKTSRSSLINTLARQMSALTFQTAIEILLKEGALMRSISVRLLPQREGTVFRSGCEAETLLAYLVELKGAAADVWFHLDLEAVAQATAIDSSKIFKRLQYLRSKGVLAYKSEGSLCVALQPSQLRLQDRLIDQSHFDVLRGLHLMSQYHKSQCKRAFVLQHFGDANQDLDCTLNCDGCQRGPDEVTLAVGLLRNSAGEFTDLMSEIQFKRGAPSS